MGYLRDHAIVVSHFYDGAAFRQAHQKAVEIFGDERVSPILGPFTNNHQSFFVAPDGSKEWWPKSDENDVRREMFCRELRALRGITWAEIVTYDEDGNTGIVRESHGGGTLPTPPTGE